MTIFAYTRLFIILNKVRKMRDIYMSLLSNFYFKADQRICNKNGINAGYKFAFQCNFKEQPFLMIGFTLVLSILLFTLFYRIT